METLLAVLGINTDNQHTLTGEEHSKLVPHVALIPVPLSLGNKLSNAVTSYFDHLSQTKHSKTSCVLCKNRCKESLFASTNALLSTAHLRRSSKHAVVFESLCAMIIKMMKVNHPGKGKVNTCFMECTCTCVCMLQCFFVLMLVMCVCVYVCVCVFV